MSDTASSNILVVNPDGRISAALSGSLKLLADVNNVPGFFVSDQHAIVWTDAAGRVVAANVGTVDTTDDSGYAAQRAYTPDGGSGAEISEFASARNVYVKASAWTPTSQGAAVVIESDGSSGFLQQQFPSRAQIQWGSTRVNVPNTAALVNVPLAQPWTTNHLFFAAFVTFAPVGFDFQLIRGCWPNNNSSGEIYFDSSSAQTLSINYLSIGY